MADDLKIFLGQANKGGWWMPWHRQAMKDAIPAKILGELGERIDPGVSEWGNPVSISSLSLAEFIG